MCKYCDGSEKELPVVDSVASFWLGKYDDYFVLEYQDQEGWTVETDEINFCPMCGRKLNEEV